MLALNVNAEFTLLQPAGIAMHKKSGCFHGRPTHTKSSSPGSSWFQTARAARSHLRASAHLERNGQICNGNGSCLTPVVGSGLGLGLLGMGLGRAFGQGCDRGGLGLGLRASNAHKATRRHLVAQLPLVMLLRIEGLTRALCK